MANWMEQWPDAASAAAAAVAVAVRASIADVPRSRRVVLLDAIATGGLCFLAFHALAGLPPALGGPLSPQFASGLSGFLGVVGWASVTRWAWRRWGGGVTPPPSTPGKPGQ